MSGQPIGAMGAYDNQYADAMRCVNWVNNYGQHQLEYQYAIGQLLLQQQQQAQQQRQQQAQQQQQQQQQTQQQWQLPRLPWQQQQQAQQQGQQQGPPHPVAQQQQIFRPVTSDIRTMAELARMNIARQPWYGFVQQLNPLSGQQLSAGNPYLRQLPPLVA
ncbi:MAG: hypothetical protein K6E29_03750 [Cyanobacteria bacterium RUI128]|nr:hypothetical protein [Cyanobacteria bacterium RUI128]